MDKDIKKGNNQVDKEIIKRNFLQEYVWSIKPVLQKKNPYTVPKTCN